MNVDLSTLSAASDVVLGLGEPLEEIIDINFQTGPDPYLAGRTEMYRAVLYHQYHVPVRTFIVLMRPAADHAHLTGSHSYGIDTNGVKCGYEVKRLFEQSPESFLQAGIGLAPLAVLCKLPEELPEEAAIAAIVRHLYERLSKEVPEAEAIRLMTGAYTLTGLRIRDEETLVRIFEEYGMIKKNLPVWDQKLLEGELRGVRKTILGCCTIKFGSPRADVKAALSSIDDEDRLDRIVAAMVTATSWDELLATP